MRAGRDAQTRGGPGPELVSGDGPDSWVLRLHGHDQSHVDLLDPTRLAFDYVRRLGDVVDLAAPPGERLRVVHVGGGGLTLPRYVAATRPGSRQVVLEPDQRVVDLVRRELPLPPRSGIRVRPVDGRSGLPAIADGSTDVVVVDAFVEGRVPLDLVTVECFGELARVLSTNGPGGLLILNLVDRAPFRHARDVVAGMREVLGDVVAGAEPATLRGRRAGNLLLLGGRSVPVAALAARASRGASPYRVLAPPEVRDRLGGGDALRDGAPTSPSGGES